jgi:Ankyrin repeats (3 copies)
MLLLYGLIFYFLLPSVSYTMEEPTSIFAAMEETIAQEKTDILKRYVKQHKNEVNSIQQDTRDVTPLLWLVYSLHPSQSATIRNQTIPAMIQILLDNGAQPTPLVMSVAAGKGNTAAVNVLIPRSKNIINQVLDLTGTTALHAAVSSGNPETVKILLNEGANSTIKDGDDNTALDMAVEWQELDPQNTDQYRQIIKLLTDKGANVIKPINLPLIQEIIPAFVAAAKPMPTNPSGSSNSPSGQSASAALGGNLGNAAQRNKLLQKIIGGAIVATAALYGFYHYLSQPVFISSTLYGQELVDQLTDLLSTHDIEHAYALAEYNQDNLGNLSDIQRIALLSAINQAHGSITQAHATTYSWLSWYRSKSESDQFRQLHLIATLIHQSTPQLTKMV